MRRNILSEDVYGLRIVAKAVVEATPGRTERNPEIKTIKAGRKVEGYVGLTPRHVYGHLIPKPWRVR